MSAIARTETPEESDRRVLITIGRGALDFSSPELRGAIVAAMQGGEVN